MTRHETMAQCIPWYVNGTLDTDERRELEEHLASCEACRGLEREARELRGLGEAQDDELLDHVQAQHLERYALDPASLAQHLAAWIREHVDACPACGEALRLLGGEASPQPHEPARPAWTRLGSLLSGTLLHPVAALAYLLLLVAVLPQLGRDDRNPWPGGRVELPLVFGAVRSDEVVRVQRGAADWVPLGVEPERPQDESRGPVRFVVHTAAGQVAWATEAPIAGVRADLAEVGIVVLMLPAEALTPGRHRLLVTDVGRDHLLLDATFDVE